MKFLFFVNSSGFSLHSQVTPGANTDGDLSTSRTSEPALLTPRTPSSRGTPEENGIKNDFANFSFNSPQPITSLSGSPSSPLDINLYVQTPLKLKNGSPLQETPPHLVGGLFEGLPWQTATPRLPERNAHRIGVDVAAKNYSAPARNGLNSSLPYNISTPLVVNSGQLPDGVNEVSGSKQTSSSLGGYTLQGEKQESLPSQHITRVLDEVTLCSLLVDSF